jgi:hypothetical protein
VTQIRSTGLTIFVYAGTQVGRVLGASQAGETDLRSTFTTANTAQLYAVGSSVSTFDPSNPFSPLKTLTPGQLYVIKAKQAFTIGQGFPLADSAAQSQALAVVRTAIANAGGNPPPAPSGFMLGMNI